MDVNVTQLKIEWQSMLNIWIQSEQMIKEGQVDPLLAHPMHVVISDAEAKFMCQTLRGETEFYPWYDDIGYLVKTYSDGMRIISLSAGCVPHSYGHKYRDVWFVFPGAWLAEKIEKGEEWEASAAELAEIRRKYAGSWRVSYSDAQVERYFKSDMADKDNELADSFKWLTEIAVRHSHGQPSIISISHDGWGRPGSGLNGYLWSIVDGDGRRVLSGGLVPHRGEDGTYKYSSHT